MSPNREIEARDPYDLRRAGLETVRAFNRRGEFRSALDLCEQAAPESANQAHDETLASFHFEAAWACTHLGDLDSARVHMERTTAALGPRAADRVWSARFKWIEGRILREQGQFAEAACSFEQARREFGDALDGVRCTRELGHTLSRTNPAEALEVLGGARALFEQAHCPDEVALCDLYLAQALERLNRFQLALDRLTRARELLLAQGLYFFTACCELDAGSSEWRLNHFDAALTLFQQAHDYFSLNGAESESVSCQINLGGVLCELNRYDEAFAHFQRGAENAQLHGQRHKAAVCYANMGWVRTQQGRYAEALKFYQRARGEFEREQMWRRVAQLCDVNSGLVYLRLGQYTQACLALETARELFQKENLVSDLAECEMYLAQAQLGLEQGKQAYATLEHARELFGQNGQEVYAAVCDRLLAPLQDQMGDWKGARTRLLDSRARFSARGMIVDVALCDLAEGELRLRWRQYAKARRLFANARATLQPAFPDHSWRVDYGLARIAQARGEKEAALGYYLDAVQTIAGIRADLVTEQQSNDLFGSRLAVYEEALESAVTQRDSLAALQVIEAAKARLLLAQLARRDWSLPDPSSNDTSVDELSKRESELRQQLARLQASLAATNPSLDERSTEDMTRRRAMSDLFKDLEESSHCYETVMAQLRVAHSGMAGTPSLAPFEVAQLRERASARWGENSWAALDYFLDNDRLTVIYVDAWEVQVRRHRLSAHEQFLLRQCADTHSDLRERIYRGTLRGMPVPASCDRWLERLAERLLPERVLKENRHLTLLLSPHQMLHQLPFHALQHGGRHLMERFTFLYTPAFQVWVQLEASSRREPSDAEPRILLCGLSEFGDACPLEHAEHEVRELAALGGDRVTTLWGREAQRHVLLDMNASGALQEFDILHLTTHAVIEPEAPHWSRILLADEPLTVADILSLKLNARLVTLSACSSAIGQSGDGDEWVALARAFFYAGARAVLVSLWPVEDNDAVVLLLTEFYRRILSGMDLAPSLREAQLTLRAAGESSYVFSPFILIGAESNRTRSNARPGI